jgi:hypothetical protein
MLELTTFFLLVQSDGFNIFIPDQWSRDFVIMVFTLCGFNTLWLRGFHASSLSSIILKWLLKLQSPEAFLIQ